MKSIKMTMTCHDKVSKLITSPIETKPQITEEEQLETLKKILKQKIQISKQITLRTFNTIKIKCYDCGNDIRMIMMYKCFQCNLYICNNCAPEHFNIDLDSIPRLIKKGK